MSHRKNQIRDSVTRLDTGSLSYLRDRECGCFQAEVACRPFSNLESDNCRFFLWKIPPVIAGQVDWIPAYLEFGFDLACLI